MIFKRRLLIIDEKDRQIYLISKWLKHEIGYSYKRRGSRSYLCNYPKLKYLQWIFACREMNMILDEKTKVNVDEASQSRLVRLNYSWLPRGLDRAIINSK